MPQIFRPPRLLLLKATAAAVALSVVAAAALPAWSRAVNPGAESPIRQPIPFSHKHHAGDDGIDCRYCHALAETSREAGVPDTQTCMTCHLQLFVDAPLLAPLRMAARTGERLHWRRVHDLPDFVYFDHSVHVRSGVACAECHGDVAQMPVIRKAASLEMQWCLDCHRNHERQARAAHFVAFSAPGAGAPPDERRLTDCSTCHR